jgi:carboxypeptidase C (cathepsin A)
MVVSRQNFLSLVTYESHLFAICPFITTGCSSFHAGLFLEMGPVTVPLQSAGSFGQPADAKRGFNQYAWSNVTTIMYVEQPGTSCSVVLPILCILYRQLKLYSTSVGTGFSNGAAPPMDEEGVSADFYNFLLNWNTIFPEHASKRLYLVGESYAGN